MTNFRIGTWRLSKLLLNSLELKIVTFWEEFKPTKDWRKYYWDWKDLLIIRNFKSLTQSDNGKGATTDQLNICQFTLDVVTHLSLRYTSWVEITIDLCWMTSQFTLIIIKNQVRVNQFKRNLNDWLKKSL